jgi:hypothetical protein
VHDVAAAQRRHEPGWPAASVRQRHCHPVVVGVLESKRDAADKALRADRCADLRRSTSSESASRISRKGILCSLLSHQHIRAKRIGPKGAVRSETAPTVPVRGSLRQLSVGLQPSCGTSQKTPREHITSAA